MKQLQYIAIDFDGTIVDHDYPNIGQPAPSAIRVMLKWQKLGLKLILFTMRSGHTLQMAIDYCAVSGIYFYGVNTNPDQGSWTTSPKAYAQLYIDDAALGCPLMRVKGFNRLCVDWETVESRIDDILEDEVEL